MHVVPRYKKHIKDLPKLALMLYGASMQGDGWSITCPAGGGKAEGDTVGYFSGWMNGMTPLQKSQIVVLATGKGADECVKNTYQAWCQENGLAGILGHTFLQKHFAHISTHLSMYPPAVSLTYLLQYLASWCISCLTGVCYVSAL